MLYEFVVANRELILERTRLQAREVDDGVTLSEGGWGGAVRLFLAQLTEALEPTAFLASKDPARRAQTTKLIGSSAALHGRDFLRSGFTVAQVVHGYGAVCQVVTELATELKVPIGTDKFQVFNRCLDDAIAGAVTAYGSERESDLADEGTERLGVYAHEVRNLLNTATLSFAAIRTGQVGASGSTGAILSRSLAGLRALTERSLEQVRAGAAIPGLERILVQSFVEELRLSATMQAEVLGLRLQVHSLGPEVAIDVDHQLLAAGMSNLLQNAFKFTPRGTVVLTARATEERVFLEVADECGGLPAGKAAELFRPFTQRSDDRSGLGLGLAIALRSARACGGDLRVRDVPGHGCVFTIELPRRAAPSIATRPVDGP